VITPQTRSRSLNVTPKTTLRGGKSARVIILLRLTTDGHKASRGLSATANVYDNELQAGLLAVNERVHRFDTMI